MAYTVCERCSHIERGRGDTPPLVCPVCGKPADITQTFGTFDEADDYADNVYVRERGE